MEWDAFYHMDSQQQQQQMQQQQDMMAAAANQGPPLGAYPERPGEPDCSYFLKTGQCAFGFSCRYNHPPDGQQAAPQGASWTEYPERSGQPDCQYYLKTGSCKFGATCTYHHPKKKAGGGTSGRVVLNMGGYPLRIANHSGSKREARSELGMSGISQGHSEIKSEAIDEEDYMDQRIVDSFLNEAADMCETGGSGAATIAQHMSDDYVNYLPLDMESCKETGEDSYSLDFSQSMADLHSLGPSHGCSYMQQSSMQQQNNSSLSSGGHGGGGAEGGEDSQFSGVEDQAQLSEDAENEGQCAKDDVQTNLESISSLLSIPACLEAFRDGNMLTGPSLRLNYEDVLTAWSWRGGSPWLDEVTSMCPSAQQQEDPDLKDALGVCGEPEMSLVLPKQGSGEYLVGYIADICQPTEGREERVMRYREKKRNRLFSKTIRYEVRKLNAERRPRIKVNHEI
eukprot:jgi/Mesen1/749/ME000110S_11017